MDLSVLNGPDPAGYKAEKLAKGQKGTSSGSGRDRSGTYITPGSIAAADSGQFHVYRRTRRVELDRMERFEQEREEEAKELEFQQQRRQRQAELEAKMAKKKAKRERRKAKGAKAVEPKETPHGESTKKVTQ